MILTKFVFVLSLVFSAFIAQAGVVTFKNDQLHVDGVAQPQLFGAELQYFRLRGAYGPNVPRAQVVALWNKALDRMVEAKMNAISFYIPWDFHEYAEGKFDFTGTVDEDRDGNPDYPSRDVITFFKLIEAHGIRTIMVRPGPYINAEWGFLGFGAVPKWFSDKFPSSKMSGPSGQPARLYDYHDPDFLRYSELWMRELHKQVLKDFIGAGRPISFVQLDNETNFQWQSIFNLDYGPRAIQRYRDFLRTTYGTIEAVNAAHGRSWTSFTAAEPARVQGRNSAEDRDWYRFQDESIRSYLEKIRRIWESLGVSEPTVLFTLAESYNAAPHGLLPNYHHRNEPGRTGLMTVNLYPKTYELPSKPLLNLPFKADHDVKAADTANDLYLGSRQEWVMGPEIQGGWWTSTPVTTAARRQTYLTTLGHGLKALFVYYFTEGWNWQVEKGTFPLQSRELTFDSPLDSNANPRSHFSDLKLIGEKLIAPHRDFMGRAKEMADPVCFLRESEQHAYSPNSNVDALAMNGEWAGGLLGFMMQAGVNPEILHWGLSPEAELANCRVIVRQDNGLTNANRTAALDKFIRAGGAVVNFIDSTLLKELGLGVRQVDASTIGVTRVTSGGASFSARATPLFRFENFPATCSVVVSRGNEAIGFECPFGAGRIIQVGSVFYDRYNSDFYSEMTDVAPQRALLDKILRSAGVEPRVKIAKGGDRVVAFGRTDGAAFMVTVKSSLLGPTRANVIVREALTTRTYRVRDLFSTTDAEMPGSVLSTTGAPVDLGANGSTVLMFEPAR